MINACTLNETVVLWIVLPELEHNFLIHGPISYIHISMPGQAIPYMAQEYLETIQLECDDTQTSDENLQSLLKDILTNTHNTKLACIAYCTHMYFTKWRNTHQQHTWVYITPDIYIPHVCGSNRYDNNKEEPGNETELTQSLVCVHYLRECGNWQNILQYHYNTSWIKTSLPHPKDPWPASKNYYIYVLKPGQAHTIHIGGALRKFTMPSN